MLQYFISPAKADLFPTDGGRALTPTTPVTGMQTVKLLHRFCTLQWGKVNGRLVARISVIVSCVNISIFNNNLQLLQLPLDSCSTLLCFTFIHGYCYSFGVDYKLESDEIGPVRWNRTRTSVWL